MNQNRRGQIIEKAPGVFLVRVYLGRIDGKKKYAGEQVRGSKKDAEAVLTKKLREMDVGAFVVPSKLTVQTYFTDWLMAKTGIGTKTKNDYEHRLKKDVYPSIGMLQLRQVTPTTIEHLYGSLLSDRQLGPRTVRYTHTVLTQGFAKAVTRGMLQRNPCEGVELPKLPRSGSAATILDFAQTKHLLDTTAQDPLHALWRLLLTAGLRPQEALALQWGDLDASTRTIAIQRALHDVGKGHYEVTTELKTDESARKVPLSKETVDALLAHKQVQLAAILKMGSKYVRQGYIFANRYGHPQDMSWVRKSWNAALVKAGLPEIRLYDSRHTHLSQLLASGVNAKAVADRSGHKDPSVLLSVYAHTLPAVALDAADRIEQQLAKVASPGA